MDKNGTNMAKWASKDIFLWWRVAYRGVTRGSREHAAYPVPSYGTCAYRHMCLHFSGSKMPIIDLSKISEFYLRGFPKIGATPSSHPLNMFGFCPLTKTMPATGIPLWVYLMTSMHPLDPFRQRFRYILDWHLGGVWTAQLGDFLALRWGKMDVWWGRLECCRPTKRAVF